MSALAFNLSQGRLSHQLKLVAFGSKSLTPQQQIHQQRKQQAAILEQLGNIGEGKPSSVMAFENLAQKFAVEIYNNDRQVTPEVVGYAQQGLDLLKQHQKESWTQRPKVKQTKGVMQRTILLNSDNPVVRTLARVRTALNI